MTIYSNQKTIQHDCALSTSNMAPSLYSHGNDAEPGFNATAL
jgi:hypothetical protein